MWQMTPYYGDRIVDTQYRDRLNYILEHGERKEKTIQGVPQIVCLHTPAMVFDLKNGIPLITERDLFFWQAPVGELCAFINGARTQAELEKFGCRIWKRWVTKEKCAIFGLEEGDLGPGSYGPGFGLQWPKIVEQIMKAPHLATHEISPWQAQYITTGERKVVVAPCHGWVHFEVINGRLHMIMRQRSADFPVGVPSNMIQYATMLLAVARITGYEPGCFIHQFCNAHVYANQIEWVQEMMSREPRRLPTMTLVEPFPTNICDVRKEHFVLSDYYPHPRMSDIPVAI